MDLASLFQGLIATSIGDDGVYPHLALAVRPNGCLECLTLYGGPKQVLAEVCRQVVAGRCRELFVGLDAAPTAARTFGPDADAGLIVWWWRDGYWRPGLLPYSSRGRAVRPYQWSNQRVNRDAMAWIGDYMARARLAAMGFERKRLYRPDRTEPRRPPADWSEGR